MMRTISPASSLPRKTARHVTRVRVALIVQPAVCGQALTGLPREAHCSARSQSIRKLSRASLYLRACAVKRGSSALFLRCSASRRTIARIPQIELGRDARGAGGSDHRLPIGRSPGFWLYRLVNREFHSPDIAPEEGADPYAKKWKTRVPVDGAPGRKRSV